MSKLSNTVSQALRKNDVRVFTYQRFVSFLFEKLGSTFI